MLPPPSEAGVESETGARVWGGEGGGRGRRSRQSGPGAGAYSAGAVRSARNCTVSTTSRWYVA